MSNSFFTTWNPSWTGGFSQGNDEDDILEDENAEYQNFWNFKDSILFAIDCNKEMQEKGFVLNAIKCARSVLESKIISSENDVVGILLYNTKQTRNVSQFPLIYMFQDMDQPDAQRIMELEKMEKDLENGQLNVTESCEDDQMASYQDLFWICSTIFSQKAHKMGSKRIFLITNEDHPHATNPALQTSALRRAKDLNELGISIELFMFNKANKNFDLNIFYKNVVEEEDIQNAESKFEELMVRIRRKETKKRPLQKILFGLGENFNISLKVFLLFSPARKGNHVYLDSRTNNEVNVMTEYICKDSASNLLPSDIKNYFEYGGEKAIFNKDELLKIKKFGPAGLTLLGFKPKERLKLKYNLKNSYFIYPDDSQVKQSSLFFSHFLDKLEAKGKIAICRYIARDYSKPSIVALLPQKEQFDENGIQIKPPGAHLITLPFADDLRSLPNDSIQKANHDQVDKAKEIVAKLTLHGGFNYDNFENPAIQKHYAVLQALALDRENLEDFNDNTIPKYEQMDKRISSLVEEFNTLTGLSNIPNEEKFKATTKKRSANEESKTTKKKKAETNDEPEENVSIEEIVKSAHAKGTLSKLTIPSLKEYLAHVGVKPKKLRKADLLEQVEELLSQ